MDKTFLTVLRAAFDSGRDCTGYAREPEAAFQMFMRDLRGDDDIPEQRSPVEEFFDSLPPDNESLADKIQRDPQTARFGGQP